MKKIRGNKSIGVIMHVYMEISKGNTLCSYLYLKQAKISFFYSTKLENRRAEHVLGAGGALVPIRGETGGKGVGG
jgi:hypothetical protein